MQIESLKYDNEMWSFTEEVIADKGLFNLVFVFGDTDIFKQESTYTELRKIYPLADIIGCSSSGNVLGSTISDSTIVASAVQFDNIQTKISIIDFNSSDNVEYLSSELVENLLSDDLKHVFLLSDGLSINGSGLVRGLNKKLKNVTVSGGMAGDGARFQETWILANDVPKQKRIVAIGFYGDSVITTGCFAGWSEFGTERTITKSKDNILFELDGEPALDLYKKYLGEYAQDLPSSGLRFPLSIKNEENSPEVIRTLLSIDEGSKSITFAGDVPIGYKARLMKPDIDLLINGAELAAEEIEQVAGQTGLALIVSCVGRKIIMNQFVDEELEAVQNVLGNNAHLTGFYSYGEFAPFINDKFTCQLHNQTMTLTVIYEK